jgi:hypothetical protein
VGRDEREGLATYFPEVGEGGRSPEPAFSRGLPVDGGRAGDVGE